jgi:Dimethyladenosine transferase (rRNA methylation)
MIKPKKSLGQNFLINNDIIKQIVSLENVKDKNILEIGPGTGNLTKEIIIKKPKTLILVEKDIELFKKLESRFSFLKNLKILNRDILELDIENNLKKDSIVFWKITL